MKTVNSLSGGKTSSYIAVHRPADYEVFSLVCIEDPLCTPKDKSLLQYVNAKLEKFIPKYGEFIGTAEDDRTLIALRDLEQFIGREIIWVRGKSFDSILETPHFSGGKPTRLPSWARRYCTIEMKLYPIFLWWFDNIGEKVNMRIGFRFDEYDRMERFFNNSAPAEFRIPVSCSTKGQKLQKHETFNWRFCSFPLIKNAITSEVIHEFWRQKGYLPANLYQEARKIEFPEISNCVGCFHKKPTTLAVQFNLNQAKMNWFARQEERGMGTWLDNKTTYADIGKHALSTPYIAEMIDDGSSCDSGGCHD